MNFCFLKARMYLNLNLKLPQFVFLTLLLNFMNFYFLNASIYLNLNLKLPKIVSLFLNLKLPQIVSLAPVVSANDPL